ncbi:hypothetical protein CBOM_04684 [Ceraceosorus bombacis]|uniref:Uncharacterized protein n=1 Tax=Ceraceosorus bombacis TaxID=401625 RepID=A0A0P1BQX0_9BASI|nr:hypothetical protein CBOM_04684 [Ceraceosorus bombacis]
MLGCRLQSLDAASDAALAIATAPSDVSNSKIETDCKLAAKLLPGTCQVEVVKSVAVGSARCFRREKVLCSQVGPTSLNY